jgi:hypothetical protein
VKGSHAVAAVTAARNSWRGWPVATRIQVACQALSLAGDTLLEHRRRLAAGNEPRHKGDRLDKLVAALQVLFDEYADQRVAVLEKALVDESGSAVKV